MSDCDYLVITFDTEKAVLVGECNNIGSGADSCNDFNWWEAGLYQTPRSKRFFLAGRGGPMTQFSHSAGQNSWTGGERIIPMDKDGAYEWAERYLGTETVLEYFPDKVEEA